MTKKIPLCKPSINQKEFKKIKEVLKSSWLTHGPFNEEFEESFARYIGVKYALTINSCASALFASLKAQNITGEVIIPSFTFVATANAVITAGAVPVFADIDYLTGNTSIKHIKPLINSRTEAIIPVHFAGQSCQMDGITNLANKYKLALIEDSAEAIGATFRNKKTGSFGTGCFSFFPTKNMTTGEGGMITSNDAALIHKIKVLISHGIDKTQNKKFIWQRDAIMPGWNLRMSGILAGIGIEQLKKINKLNELRVKHSEYLTKRLDASLLETPTTGSNSSHVYQMYTIKVKQEIRDELVASLNREGVGASVHFSPPVHKQKLFKKFQKNKLPNTERLSSSIITLPMYPDLTKKDLDIIADKTNKLIKKIYGKI
ncbi:MAG: DegT/DnrJ/EryC1/StrS family aminotransferase [Candidatus Portnoybacteria bacterium CG10_big_fil_rev_8_21_14_0_10_36_7]|uniref:DegT/DnrJ/EryC1/StrS family aminotransferase n=1 Tax=Candidatus Portnoybacteria bacterium CG10_big_fil_rev_8_21_14_0_10_36_7 TaxID=1974812 RepID=A0A2M8KDB1_9BACT|nr:MAG: DegT/DnrJ/EryC1/StrS family aminotransferase [Candidatus Portnoybacteria bacterium CG10_big_fil_rev_8_21_14_0_10_36_7]